MERRVSQYSRTNRSCTSVGQQAAYRETAHCSTARFSTGHCCAGSRSVNGRVSIYAAMLIGLICLTPLLAACRLPKRDKWQLPDAAEAGLSSQAASPNSMSDSGAAEYGANDHQETNVELKFGASLASGQDETADPTQPSKSSAPEFGVPPINTTEMNKKSAKEFPQSLDSRPPEEPKLPEFPSFSGSNSLIPETMQLPESPSLTSAPSEAPSSPLRLRIAGVDPDQGPVRVAVFTAAEAFPNYQQASNKAVLPSASTTLHGEIDGVKAEAVAIAVYQDLNNDGQLNRSSYGIPTEPYGFSNNARGKMGPPSFDAAQVQIGSNSTVIPISLTKLKF
jgi:uncharacterized protein (DUF2141 family)